MSGVKTESWIRDAGIPSLGKESLSRMVFASDMPNGHRQTLLLLRHGAELQLTTAVICCLWPALSPQLRIVHLRPIDRYLIDICVLSLSFCGRLSVRVKC